MEGMQSASPQKISFPFETPSGSFLIFLGKASTENKSESEDVSQKYKNLKRKFSALRDVSLLASYNTAKEYLKTLEGWEESNKKLKKVSHERK